MSKPISISERDLILSKLEDIGYPTLLVSVNEAKFLDDSFQTQDLTCYTYSIFGWSLLTLAVKNRSI